HSHPAFVGGTVQLRIGESRVANRHRMIAAGMREERMTGCGHSFPKRPITPIGRIVVLAVLTTVHKDGATFEATVQLVDVIAARPGGGAGNRQAGGGNRPGSASDRIRRRVCPPSEHGCPAEAAWSSSGRLRCSRLAVSRRFAVSTGAATQRRGYSARLRSETAE